MQRDDCCIYEHIFSSIYNNSFAIMIYPDRQNNTAIVFLIFLAYWTVLAVSLSCHCPLFEYYFNTAPCLVFTVAAI